MTVELTTDEVRALRDLLGRHLGDLSAEISHTDNPGFRHQIRDNRDLLRQVYDKLAAAHTLT